MQNTNNLKIASYALALLFIAAAFTFAPWWSVIFAIFGTLLVALTLLKLPKEKEQIQNNQSQKDESETTFRPIKSNVSFKDIAGVNEAKAELQEIVDYFKNPAKYRKFGVKLPKGILLTGEPGVGKTLMAKAVAKEAGVNFFYAGGASFVHMFVGVGPKKVSELFSTARKNAPSIIFIDEIDAVGKKRGGNRADERENTLNQLLTEMDGFESTAQVVVIAATNQIDMLDTALLRAGRFDRKIEIAMPNAKDRADILKLYFAEKPHSLDLEDVGEKCIGFSGASLATLANEAAINAIRRGAEKIEPIDIESVKDKIIDLKKTGEYLDDISQEKLAIYQLAKAQIAKRNNIEFEAVKLEGNFLPKIGTIVSKKELLDLIRSYLAGVALQEIRSDDAMSFSKSDITKAKELITIYKNSFDPADKFDTKELVTLMINEAKEQLDLIKIDELKMRLVEEKQIEFSLL